MEILILVVFYLSLQAYNLYLESPSFGYLVIKSLDFLYTDSHTKYTIVFYSILLILFPVYDLILKKIKKKWNTLFAILNPLMILSIGFVFYIESLFHISLDWEILFYTLENVGLFLPSISILKEGNFVYCIITFSFAILSFLIHRWKFILPFLNVTMPILGFILFFILGFLHFYDIRKSLFLEDSHIFAKTNKMENSSIPISDFRVETFPIDFYFKKKWKFTLKNPNLNIVVFLLESVRKDFFDPSQSKFFKLSDPRNIHVSNFYIPVPHSSNTHFTILTGLYPLKKIHSIYNSNLKEKYSYIYEKSLIFHLQKENYSTFYITSNDTSFENENKFLNFLQLTIIEKKDLKNYKLKEFEWGVDDTALLLKTKELLPKIKNQPFFLLYVFSNTHTPYFNPYPEKYNRFNNQIRKERYKNTIHFTIDLVDLIIQEFIYMNLYQNTLFIILSDHGETFGEHNYILHDFSLYNEEILVPFIMHHERFKHLYKDKEIPYANLLDLVPTIFDLAEISTNGNYPGQSIFSPNSRYQFFLSSWGGTDAKKGVIKNHQKWIWNFSKKKLQLLDLQDNVIKEDSITSEYEFLKTWEPFYEF